LRFSFDFDSVRIVPLAPASLPAAVLRPGGHGYGVPLGMHRMNPECLDSDRFGPSIAVTILLREEPEDEEEEDDEEHDGGVEDEDGDEGYSE